jgi:membrane protein DedA with SNARE-associated domain
VLQAPGPFQQHRVRAIAAGDKFYEKHGNKAVFFGRWIALVRVAAAWLAGINHMPFHVFFFWNALGAISWGTTFGLVGYFGGTAAANVITQVGVYAAIAGGVALFVWLIVRVWRRRSAGEPSG